MHDLLRDVQSDTRSGIDDCWNQIGVRGDASCPKLIEHAHCRNCPSYSTAARALLDRNPPAGYLSDWTSHFAQGKQVQEADAQAAVIFRIGAEWFALPTMVLDEVAEQRTIHSLPHRQGGVVLGLVNVRGELLVCVSLGRLLGLADTAWPAAHQFAIVCGHLVVIGHEGGRLAFPVDEVKTSHRYNPSELRAPPATIFKAAVAHTKAILPWRDKIVGLLDDQIIFEELNRSLA
jgi:chemotaxis-related protein WspD